MRYLLAMLGGLLCAALFSVIDWESLLPAASRGLLAVIIPMTVMLAVSTALRSRAALGVHHWSVAFMAAGLTYAVVALLANSTTLVQTAWVASGSMAYFAIIAVGGRRPYEGCHRLEAVIIAFAVLAGLVSVFNLQPDIAALDLDAMVMLVVALLVLVAALGLVIAQGWWPSRGSGLILLGALALVAAQLFGLDGSTVSPPTVLVVISLALLMAGTVIGDDGMPPPDRHIIAVVVLGLANLVALGTLIEYGTGHNRGAIAEVLAIVVLVATFGRAIMPRGIVSRTDPAELGGIDRLTGLPDRYELEAVLERELQYGAHRNTPVAVAVLDLINLHQINETLAHRVGDEVLREFAARLSSYSGIDVPVRLAGNTFALIMRAHSSERDAREVLEKMIDRLEAPLQVDGVSLAVQVRVGLVFFPAHGRTVAELLQRAEIASQEAKDQQVSLLVYDPSRDMRSREQLIFAAELREGIERDELRAYFQPKIDLATGLVIGAEALVRWEHPELGLLTPDRFLPVAERTGQMGALTTWVLNAALRQVQRWRTAGLALHVAVNLSPHNLVDTTLPGRLAHLLERYGLRGTALELEITEDMAMADPGRTAEVIQQINELGIGFALDDFGTGYSSLAHLKYLNCNELKIDRSFVRDIVSDEDDRVIVWSILDLARNLGMRTVAEGIESPEVVQMLAMMGCSVGQGFHYAKPLDADTFMEWCEEQRDLGTIRLLSDQGEQPGDVDLKESAGPAPHPVLGASLLNDQASKAVEPVATSVITVTGKDAPSRNGNGQKP